MSYLRDRARQVPAAVLLVPVLVLDVVSAWRAVAQPASDVRTYRQWITGDLPGWIAPGPYPVAADLLWWPLRWVPAPQANLWWFLAVTGPATVAACLVLGRTARRPGPAVLVWLLAAGLLERTYWMRLEPLAALAVLLMIVGVRRGRVAWPALALSLGAMVKVWPVFLAPAAVLLLAVRRGRRAVVTWLGWFALPWVVFAAAVVVMRPPHPLTWLTFTLTRRTQAESLSVLPALWAMAAGSDTWRMTYVGGLDSADIVLGPHLRLARGILQVAGVVLLAVLAWRVLRAMRRREAGEPDGGECLALVLRTQVAMLLIVIFCGPVFSPQYLVWFAAPLAVAAGEGLLRREAGLWLAGCALTFVEFPLLWNEMRRAEPLAVAALTARDAVLVVFLAVCLRELWRVTGRPAGAIVHS